MGPGEGADGVDPDVVVGARLTVVVVPTVDDVAPDGSVTGGVVTAVMFVVVVTGDGTVAEVDAYCSWEVVATVGSVVELAGGLTVVCVLTVVVLAASEGWPGCSAGGCVAGDVVVPRRG